MPQQRFATRQQLDDTDDQAGPAGGFGDEFRHLAQRRRFARYATAPEPERLSHDPAGSMTELARMADRLIEARDNAAVLRARAERAEREAATLNDRLLASRALVHEAQRIATVAAERASYLDGRCEALEQALDLSLNASLVRRWRWRRRLRNSE